jgi:hypothetical protein
MHQPLHAGVQPTAKLTALSSIPKRILQALAVLLLVQHPLQLLLQLLLLLLTKQCSNLTHTSTHRQLHCRRLRHPSAVGVLAEVQRHAGPVRRAALAEGRLEGQLYLLLS